MNRTKATFIGGLVAVVAIIAGVILFTPGGEAKQVGFYTCQNGVLEQEADRYAVGIYAKRQLACGRNIKQANPEAQILQYFAGPWINGPSGLESGLNECTATQKNSSTWANSITMTGAEFCDINDAVVSGDLPESIFLHNSNGSRITENTWGVYRYRINIGSPEMRELFKGVLLRELDNSVVDSIYIDDAVDNPPASVEYTTAQWREAMVDFMAYLQAELDAPLWANVVYADDYMLRLAPHLDGLLVETWGLTWNAAYIGGVQGQLDRLDALNIPVALIAQGNEVQKGQKYALALAYLTDNWAFTYYGSSAALPEYDYKLGDALAPRYSSGGELCRDFENGRVCVNLTDKSALFELVDNNTPEVDNTNTPGPPPPTPTVTKTQPGPGNGDCDWIVWSQFVDNGPGTYCLQPGQVYNGEIRLTGNQTLKTDGQPMAKVLNPGGMDDQGVHLSGSGNVVENLYIEAGEHGVHIGETNRHSSNNIVRNVEITNSGGGVRIYGEYNLIERNYIHDLKMARNTQGGDDDWGATAIWLFSNHNEIAYNRMVRCNAPSYDYGTDGGTVEFWASSGKSAGDNYIHHNYAESNKGFSEFGGNGGSARNNRIEHNIVVNNIGNIISSHMPGTSFGVDMSGLIFDHNTLYLKDTDTVSLFYFSKPPSSSTVTWTNNIMWLGSGVEKFTYRKDNGFTHDHNVYYRISNGTLLNITLGQGEFEANPLLNTDYSLQANSPAIGAASDGSNLGAWQGGVIPPTITPSVQTVTPGVTITHTNTPTRTPTPTYTYTFTPQVSTSTPTFTPTLTSTVTLVPTETPTWTSTPTITPSVTPQWDFEWCEPFIRDLWICQVE